MKVLVARKPVNLVASSATKWRSLVVVGESRLNHHEMHREAVVLRKRCHRVTFFTALFCRRRHLKDSPWTESATVPELENRLGLRRKFCTRQGVRDRCQICASSKTGREEDSHRCLDAILVLAGGQLAGGGVPVWVERRLDKALELQRSNGLVCRIVCLGGGTPHKLPILSPKGFVIHESSSCAEYLHSRGAPFSQLFKEWGSYDTIGNGYFSLTQHVIPRAWRKLAVVTSDFHMPRTEAAFEWIYGLQGAGIALQQRLGDTTAARGSRAQGFELEFHSVPDSAAVEDRIMEARREKELRSIENLSILVQQIRTLEDFHEWLHTEHKAYNSRDQHLFGDETPVPLKY